jgi:uncharacterized protein (TIGR02246 family)
MRRTALPLFLIVGLALASPTALADDAATIAAINASSAAIDDAFERQDEAKIRSLMTSDHLAITSYYGAPMGFDEVMKTLPELKMDQTITSDVTVTLLGPDAALRTFIADMKGSYKGKPLASRMFVTETLVKRDGKWLERQYQTTPLKP